MIAFQYVYRVLDQIVKLIMFKQYKYPIIAAIVAYQERTINEEDRY